METKLNSDKPLDIFDESEPSGDIVFSVDNGREMFRLCANGDIYVKGNLTTNDMDLVNALKEFLEKVNEKV